MKEQRKSRSGKVFFLVAVGLVFAGILATVLLANNHRNLDLLLTYLGYPDLLREPEPAKQVKITQSRSIRMPPARMVLPVYAFADFESPQQNFVRLIQSDPRTLCEQLKSGGFGDLDWTVSSESRDNWECSSFVELPAQKTAVDVQSSVFISIKGAGENLVTSFRVKLNIEAPADTGRVADLAGEAAGIFLRQVRWGNIDEIIAKIDALEAFDIRDFGSRIQFKKEFGETPRYNFIAYPITNRRKQAPGDLFFDRQKWFPLTGSDGLPMIDGMMAGESAEGLTLTTPENPAP
jgi:hypothetical protein